ncbi:uncharacterized protein LOC133176865 [Saccostrea echinata]|uniref:uncharacterized protein LOC133176865 n=1 Tax=Saccostrea echinata TaxID=191078 RepID=UPI002A83D78C|nr:uncharacterized protein LOC133176865 [Saccostrea echinata]
MKILVLRPNRSYAAMMFILLNLEITKANTDSCPASKKTVQSVENCPTSEKEWMRASQRKNCSAFASQCSNPDRFVYHCVINPFLNETLEVCVYKKTIVFGYCTEYSYSANRIQQSLGTLCSGFIQKPCPTGYPSDEAYKYPGCYELTKKSTTENPTTVNPSTSGTTVVTETGPVLNGSAADTEDRGDNGSVIGIVVGVLVVVAFALGGFFIYRRYSRRKKGQQPLHALDNESFATDRNPGRAIEEGTFEERRNLVPSGKPAEVEKEKKIEKVEVEQPVNLIKPEKEVTEEDDCQTLVNALSDGLERLAILQSGHSSENYNEDNKKLNVIARKIYENETNFSNETSTAIHEHIAELESLERYFRRQKDQENEYLPPD